MLSEIVPERSWSVRPEGKGTQIGIYVCLSGSTEVSTLWAGAQVRGVFDRLWCRARRMCDAERLSIRAAWRFRNQRWNRVHEAWQQNTTYQGRTVEYYTADCKTIGQLWWWLLFSGLFVWKAIIRNVNKLKKARWHSCWPASTFRQCTNRQLKISGRCNWRIDDRFAITSSIQ